MAELTDLPVDVMMNILLRFPAKPLMQFKSVCKSWYNLISDPNFATSHLEQTLTQPNLRFVFSSPHLSSADFDTFESVTELHHPLRKMGSGCADVLGSCLGLLCLGNYDACFTILLYNPTTRTHKNLPFLPKPSNFALGRRNFGLGYDGVSRDYKFVHILQSDEKKGAFRSHVMVYSLKFDSWMRVGDVPYPFDSRRDDGVFLNGFLHWVHKVFDGVEMHRSIFSFSLVDYSYCEVPQPDNEIDCLVLNLGVLDGCLCLLANDMEYSDIWIMNEYGVVRSWTRLFRVITQKSIMIFEWPVAFSMNRRELFLQMRPWRVVSLDLETMLVRDVKVCDFPRCFETQVCIENMMMLKDDGVEIPRADLQGRRKRRGQRQRRRDKRTYSRETRDGQR